MFSDVYTVDVSGSTNRELFAGNKDLMNIFHMNINLEKNTELQALMSRVGQSFRTVSFWKLYNDR